MDPIFETQLSKFITGLETLLESHRSKHYPNLKQHEVKKIIGKRYVKIALDGGAFAFIDTNGDVLKPASWTAPAKHARGNIFDSKNGLTHVGPYGVAYLR